MTGRAGPNHPVFKTLPGQIQEVRKINGFNSAKELNTAIDAIEEWLQKQNHFVRKDFDREYLDAYIMTAKGSAEKAKQRIDKRCTLRNLVPEFFDNIQMKTDFVNLHKCYKHVLSEKPTSDYYRVNICKFYNDGMKHLQLLDFARYLHVSSEYNVMNDYVIGYESVIDLSDINVAVELIKKLNPVMIQKIMVMLIEGYGAKIRAIHIVNSSKWLDSIVSLIKQGMSEKMANRLRVHTTPETLKNFIPVECLPSDYGGSEKSIDELSDNYFKELCSEKSVNFLKTIDTFTTDETKRISGKFNEEYLGMPGSFRKLNVD